MDGILYATLIGAVVGAFGTGIGAILTYFIKVNGKRIPAVLMGLSGGIMLAIVLFDMLPEAVESADWLLTVISVSYTHLWGFLQTYILIVGSVWVGYVSQVIFLP